MSATESAAAVVPPVEAETLVVKAEEPPAAVDAEVATPAPVAEAEPAVEPTAEDLAKETKVDDAKPKNPGFLTKLFSNLKVSKGPKSPKKEKKEEVVEAPVTEEAPKDAPVVEAPEVPVEAVETDKATVATETTAAIPEVVVPEEAKEQPAPQKDDSKKALKLSRRFSAKVGDFFKPKPKTEVATPAKVDELPPKIDEPAPVAPLENPASGAPAKVEESSKPVEVAPTVVAAAA